MFGVSKIMSAHLSATNCIVIVQKFIMLRGASAQGTHELDHPFEKMVLRFQHNLHQTMIELNDVMMQLL